MKYKITIEKMTDNPHKRDSNAQVVECDSLLMLASRRIPVGDKADIGLKVEGTLRGSDFDNANAFLSFEKNMPDSFRHSFELAKFILSSGGTEMHNVAAYDKFRRMMQETLNAFINEEFGGKGGPMQ